jgi:hypothetical protein
MLGNPRIDARQHPVHLQIRHRALVRERSGKLCCSVAQAHEAADNFDAGLAQSVEVDGLALGRADQL